MSKYIISVFLAFTLQFSNVFAGSEIAYFKFDNTVADEHLTYSGTAFGDITYSSGVADTAVYFNNEDHVDSEYKNQYITLPNISLTEFSLSIWIKFNRNTHYKEHNAAFYSIGSEDDGGTFFALFVDGNDRLFATLYCDGHNDVKVYQTNDLDIKDGLWHHIVVLVSNEKITMYEDGIMGNEEDTGFNIELDNQPQFFCYHQWENGEKGSSRINGYIDETKIFPYILSETEVVNLFHLSESGLISKYSFEGDMENTQNSNVDGQIYGNVTYATGKKGLCLNFDNPEHTSTEFVQDYATLEQLSVSEFSVSLWLKYEDNASTSDYVGIYTFGSKDNGSTFFGLLVDNNKRLNVHFYHDNHNDLYFRDDYIDVSDNTWHHIVATVSQTQMQLFDNGELVAQRETDFDINIKREQQYLGLLAFNNEASKATRLIGQIDELRIYNYALTSEEVSEVFLEEKDGFTKVFYLPHFVNSSYWETVLSLTNFSTESQELVVIAYGDDGEKLGETDFYLNAGQILSMGVDDLIQTTDNKSGWLEIKAYSDLLKGMATYKFLSTSGETSLPITNLQEKEYFLPVLSNSANKKSGVAFANVEDRETEVLLTLKGEYGQTVKTATITLPPLSKKSFMLEDIFGSFEDEIVSLKVVSNTSNIVCYGLTFINDNEVIVAIQGYIKE